MLDVKVTIATIPCLGKQFYLDGHYTIDRHRFGMYHPDSVRVVRTGFSQRDHATPPTTVASNTQGEVTSHSLWSQYDPHFVGITRCNALS